MSLFAHIKLAWRRARLESHEQKHGERFEIHGVQVALPAATVSQSVRIQVLRKRYERKEARCIRKYLPAGTAVIELGGSLGVISAVIRNAIGPAAPHVVVEANANLIELCTRNATLQGTAATTRVVHAAVAYGCKAVRFNCSADTLGNAIASAKARDAVEVIATTLSAVAAGLSADAQQPFALVCDIEGAELAMFQNERDLWQRVSVVIIETHPRSYAHEGTTETAFFELMQARGLKVVRRDGDVAVLRGPAWTAAAPAARKRAV